MKALSTVQLATLATAATGQAFIVIQAVSNGSAIRLNDAFPSIGDGAIGNLQDEDPAILAFDDDQLAVAAYSQIKTDLENESTLIMGEVTLITSDGPVETLDIDGPTD